MAKQVDSVYGTALFVAAKEEGKLSILLEQATAILTALTENPELTKILSHPNIESDEKLELVNSIFGGNCDDMLTGLISTAVSKNHGSKLTAILKFFISLVKEEEGIGVAKVISAMPLKDEQKNAVYSKLIETTGYKTMEIDYRIDKSIIGGLIIRIGDRVVDSSVKTQLDNLKKSLL